MSESVFDLDAVRKPGIAVRLGGRECRVFRQAELSAKQAFRLDDAIKRMKAATTPEEKSEALLDQFEILVPDVSREEMAGLTQAQLSKLFDLINQSDPFEAASPATSEGESAK